MAMPELVDFALGRAGEAASAVADGSLARLDSLTRRETEVARLVATGLTNREIADKLSISSRTVDSHLDHILTKLGLTSRTKLAVVVFHEDPGG